MNKQYFYKISLEDQMQFFFGGYITIKAYEFYVKASNSKDARDKLLRSLPEINEESFAYNIKGVSRIPKKAIDTSSIIIQ